MSAGAWGFSAAMTVCVLALLAAEHRHARAGVWVFKTLASTAFVLAGLAAGALAPGNTYGRAVLAALLLSWVGDVMLIPRSKKTFLVGLGSFLLAHVAYCGAFLSRGVSLAWALPAAGLAALAARYVIPWLLPHVERPMRAPVIAYATVISVMVCLAAGTLGAGGPWTAALGAVVFYASDLSVARERFVAPGFDNLAWGLPAYYGAQVLFVASIGAGTG